MGLNLYSKIEAYLDFEDEVYSLHKEFMTLVMTKDLDNILDIGCGQGYFLENLSINDKKSFGIDLSDEQIKVCREKGLENVASRPLNEVEDKFDCATAIFDVINYIPQEELLNFFQDTNKVLNDEAYFIFDVNSQFGFEEVAQGCITIDLEDKFIAIDAIFEDEKLTTDITLFTNENEDTYKKESDSITQHYHSSKTLQELLKKAGFEIEEIKEFNLHGYEYPDKMIFVCKK